MKIILGKLILMLKKIFRCLTRCCRCDERFSDEPSACLYAIYLNGADLWVLPQDYTVRTGQEPENMLTQEEVRIPILLQVLYLT